MLDAPTADGALTLVVTPGRVELALPERSLHIADRCATLTEHGRRRAKRTAFPLEGALVVARDIPHEDLGVWVEMPDGFRRIFGAAPRSLLEGDGLPALRRLDRLAQQLRIATSELAGSSVRAIEVGRGLDKVLLLDDGGGYKLFARRLFRDRARHVLTIHRDGRIRVIDGKRSREIVVRWRFGVTVWGDNLRFSDRDGTDLAQVAVPWIAPEDRDELARRIGQLVDDPGPTENSRPIGQ